jgi:hypothetical protein
MNFLQLCQALRREAGVQGTGPTAVTGQSGMYAKIVKWIGESYAYIQKLHPWTFLWARGTATLVNGTAVYATLPGITDLGRIWRSGVRDMTTAGNPWLQYVDWQWIDRQTAASGAPRYFARMPNGSLLFYPTPDAAISLRVDYQRDGHALVDAIDEPLIPDATLHEVIVYKALSLYGMHDENATAMATGDREMWVKVGEMADRYLPQLNTRAVPLDVEESTEPELV